MTQSLLSSSLSVANSCKKKRGILPVKNYDGKHDHVLRLNKNIVVVVVFILNVCIVYSPFSIVTYMYIKSRTASSLNASASIVLIGLSDNIL